MAMARCDADSVTRGSRGWHVRVRTYYLPSVRDQLLIAAPCVVELNDASVSWRSLRSLSPSAPHSLKLRTSNGGEPFLNGSHTS